MFEETQCKHYTTLEGKKQNKVQQHIDKQDSADFVEDDLGDDLPPVDVSIHRSIVEGES